jgi:hypothetical protein
MIGILDTPYYVTAPQILMLYNEEAWKLRGDILGRYLLPDSLSEHIRVAIFLCAIEASLQAELQDYSIVRRFIYHHSAPHKLLLLPSVNKLQ